MLKLSLQNSSAYTLVELIVVITILVILSTVGFVGYAQYTISSRDGARLSDLRSIYQGLGVAISKNGTAPTPDSAVSIYSSTGVLLSLQWSVGDTTRWAIGMESGGRDPQTGLSYTYLRFKDKKSVQLMAMMEADGWQPKLALGNPTNTVYAAEDYTDNFPVTLGKKLGVFTDCTSNSPLQDIPTYTGSGINISTGTGVCVTGNTSSWSTELLSATWVLARVLAPASTLTGARILVKWPPVSSILGATTGTQPQDLVLDSNGNVYTANYLSSNVTKITPTGISSTFGNTLSYPQAIGIDTFGNIFTATPSSTAMTRISSAGVLTLFFGEVGSFPGGIITDSIGNIYVSSAGRHNISKTTPAGVSTVYASTLSWSTAGVSPNGLTIDSIGNIYTVNLSSNNVTKITPGWVVSSFWATGSQPRRIAIDSEGNVYTSNYASNDVTKITPAGVSTTFGTTWTGPWGITIDPEGNIYTANSGSNDVTMITPAGVSTIFGTTWTGPMGIKIDPSGNIYTANSGSDNVTKITVSP